MKFINPLATLKFMGGAISIHISMACYAFYAYYYSLASISDCSHIQPFIEGEDLKISTYYDIQLMMMAHVVCIVLDVVQRCIQSKD